MHSFTYDLSGCMEEHKQKTKEIKRVFLKIEASACLFFTFYKYYKIVEDLVHM